ncbi:DnaJ domain-containing protein [Amniculicola lignicola CBS 123094]|uniref:DnaJ domain-containing protein n=1 Tax=Amniculicola lignicola CBS 123094 TaxID=1392246 RepID=A0A6A5WCL0_9PLEO|nr:DnaJ domain-containing protein [Amniculicola lignicola CBS 123094]
MADADFLEELAALGKEASKDAEIRRIRAAFRIDAYAVLNLQPGVPDSDIKRAYRSKSLLVHPDHTKNELAPDAFDRLVKAQTALLDEKARKKLDQQYDDARYLTLKQMKLTKDDTEETASEEFLELWAKNVKYVIMEDEKDYQKRLQTQMREEGRQQKKMDEENAERKRKRDADKAWEDSRDERISNWNTYKNNKSGEASKKKKKVKVIG